MRTLVTGHNGYIGSVLVPILEEAGHDVVGLDSDLFAPCTFGPPNEEIESLRLDVRDVESEHLVGFASVVHLAAVRNDPAAWTPTRRARRARSWWSPATAGR
jgi:nucleoside-diphosphate-sugar epimerase